MISYSAPGKIILSGEHSVVYTKPAFVTAVDMRLTCTLSADPHKKNDPAVSDAIAFCDEVVLTYLKKQRISIDQRPYCYTIESKIPVGRGMGSSAAFCVATVAALLHWYTGHKPEKERINSLAYQCEKHFHGMPSGVDVSASCFGGLIFYRKEFEFLKNISALNFKIPDHIQKHLILIDSGKPRENTTQMVHHVGKRYNDDPAAMDQTLSAIEKVTKRMVVSVVKEDREMFASCITTNQQLLEDLGIVSLETKVLLEKLRQYGVGKVTGAGGVQEGSGLILFYMNDLSVEEELQENYTCIPFIQDFTGVIRR